MANKKNLAIVRPSVTLVKDAEGKTLRGDYHYPAAPGCTAHVLCYNRDGDPSGDFLTEQMWSLDGPPEGLDVFFADPRVTKITRDQARVMGVTWDGEKEVDDSNAVTGLKVYCPVDGFELVCPNDSSHTSGKNVVAKRTKPAWNPAAHAHHIDDAADV